MRGLVKLIPSMIVKYINTHRGTQAHPNLPEDPSLPEEFDPRPVWPLSRMSAGNNPVLAKIFVAPYVSLQHGL